MRHYISEAALKALAVVLKAAPEGWDKSEAQFHLRQSGVCEGCYADMASPDGAGTHCVACETERQAAAGDAGHEAMRDHADNVMAALFGGPKEAA